MTNDDRKATTNHATPSTQQDRPTRRTRSTIPSPTTRTPRGPIQISPTSQLDSAATAQIWGTTNQKQAMTNYAKMAASSCTPLAKTKTLPKRKKQRQHLLRNPLWGPCIDIACEVVSRPTSKQQGTNQVTCQVTQKVKVEEAERQCRPIEKINAHFGNLLRWRSW